MIQELFHPTCSSKNSFKLLSTCMDENSLTILCMLCESLVLAELWRFIGSFIHLMKSLDMVPTLAVINILLRRTHGDFSYALELCKEMKRLEIEPDVRTLRYLETEIHWAKRAIVDMVRITFLVFKYQNIFQCYLKCIWNSQFCLTRHTSKRAHFYSLIMMILTVTGTRLPKQIP